MSKFILIEKIVRFVKSITLDKIINLLISLCFVGVCILDVKTEIDLYKCKKELANIRPVIINDICNKGEGNYDFCILKKAEYTYTEGKYGTRE